MTDRRIADAALQCLALAILAIVVMVLVGTGRQERQALELTGRRSLLEAPVVPEAQRADETKSGAVETKADAPYVGNTRSHKFHRDSCRYAGCANCTAKFKTREEAVRAGYAPGGCCDP